MEFKGTPGPWGLEYSKANNAYEIAPFDSDGGLDWSREVCITADNSKANAHLIAAVHELLEALLYYRDECSGAEPSLSVFHRMLDEAIAKALGENNGNT